ncbi:MAG: FkbM family methyltransferase [Cyclobacteriaceae bacterium]
MLLSLESLIAENNISIQGILHIGAHHAEELDLYEKIGVEKVIWIEGSPTTFQQLNKRILGRKGHAAFNLLVSDKSGQEVSFNVASFSQSSSLLEFGSHATSYPDIKTTDHVKLKTIRLDNFFTNGLGGINFLNLDIQGAELMALKGMGDLINHIEYIYLEINLVQVYKGGARLHQIDSYLGRKGFLRVNTKITNAHWGDAFYVSSTNSKMAIIANLVQALSLEAQAEIKVIRDKFYSFRKGIL